MQDIFEVIARVLVEIVVELLLKGPGYLIVKSFRSETDADPDGCLVFVVGILFWCVVITGLSLAFEV